MRTIALRFGENFAPECGTIAAHQKIIDKCGFVWYGKMGTPIADKVAQSIMQNNEPKILLIRSGKQERFWARIEDIQRLTPAKEYIPDYYRDKTEIFKTWFKIIKLENAPKDIMSRCYVASSNAPLGEVSKHSMSPYFIINIKEG